MTDKQYIPRLIAWEVTRRCNLKCTHCRAAAQDREYPGELSTTECFKVLDNIATFAKPIIILTGGEPMLRDDIYEIAAYGHKLGMRMVMAPCGMYINDATCKKILASGIDCISISIDGANAKSHDAFRGVDGAFDSAMQAIETARRNNLPFQINTTITQHNLADLKEIIKLAESTGAITFNPFLLVPTGRGKDLAEQEISPEEYESTLQWLSSYQVQTEMTIRVTCAPHFQRIIRQNNPDYKPPTHGHGKTAGSLQGHPHSKMTRPAENVTNKGSVQAAGCMGGKNFAFISHIGNIQICGFLEESAGNLRDNHLNFHDIWQNSKFLKIIRDVDSYKGKCGTCHYRNICGGCRARSYAIHNDYTASEPFCTKANRLG